MLRTVLALSLGFFAVSALAQSQPPAPVVQGAPTVSAGGMPAARAGDATGNGGQVVQGSPNVFIGGKPAARVGDKADCGVIVQGSSNVFVNGKPLARTGDGTSGC